MIGDWSESRLLYCEEDANAEVHVEILALAYDRSHWEAS